jgi:hypothetical protein
MIPLGSGEDDGEVVNMSAGANGIARGFQQRCRKVESHSLAGKKVSVESSFSNPAARVFEPGGGVHGLCRPGARLGERVDGLGERGAGMSG